MVYRWPPEHHTPYEHDKHWRGFQLDTPEMAAHVAEFDPARVLREVEAKRRILDDYERAFEDRKLHPGDLALAGARLALHGVVKLLALPYSDRPGYREEWRPA